MLAEIVFDKMMKRLPAAVLAEDGGGGIEV